MKKDPVQCPPMRQRVEYHFYRDSARDETRDGLIEELVELYNESNFGARFVAYKDELTSRVGRIASELVRIARIETESYNLSHHLQLPTWGV